MKKKPYSRIKELPLEWLWPGWIPLGALTLLDGPPEAGKTFVMADIAATISQGGELPLGAGESEPGSVLLMSNEDDPERVTKRRLRVMGADQRWVYQIEEGRVIDLAEDAHWLDELLEQTPDARLLVIDPLNAYLPKANAYRKVALALRNLIELAAKHRIAVVGVRHIVKAPKRGHVIDWGVGSIAYAGRARMMLGAAAHPFEEGKRVLAAVKCSWGPKPNSLVFAIAEDGKGDARIEWLEEASRITADDLVAKTPTNKPPAKVEECVEWLDKQVKPGGSTTTNELQERAEKAAFSATTLKRARAVLGWDAKKVGDHWEVYRPLDHPEVGDGRGSEAE